MEPKTASLSGNNGARGEATREQCLGAERRGSSNRTRIVAIRQTLVQGLSSEECTTTLSIKRVPLKAAILLLIFAFGSFTVSGTILPFTISEAHKATGTFLLTTSTSGATLPQGANATSTVSVISLQGYTGTVSLATQFTNGSLSLSFNPNSISVQAGGTVTSILTVGAAKNASIGTYSIIVTGTSAVGRRVVSSSAMFTVTVNPLADFGLYAYPYSISVVAGMTNSTSIILDSTNGFTGSVTLSATVPFGFLGVMGGQNPVTLSPAATTYTSLQVSTTSSTLLGKYNITITGASGTVSHSCIVTVNVVDPVPESLTLSGSSLLSPTGMTLSLQNNGNTPITLQSYTVTDISGDQWILANWTGPTILPGTTSAAVIFIGASCETCTYNGLFALFQQFVPGHTYTITVTTKLSNQFTFNVTA